MFNLPNCLTLARILATPVVVLLLYFEGPGTCMVAAIVFALASLTDMIDGHIARKENLVTNLGKFLDPLADKVLICSILIMLTYLNWVSAWIVILIVCRELIVTGLRAIAAGEGEVIAADKYGKLKTVLQACAIVPLTIHYTFIGINVQALGEFVLYIALILTVVSGTNYVCAYYRTLVKKAV